ncbi:MAG: ImmA/IrrE family metallo-endopeptidase [Betaproteobacteria bacterium AqS2]|uniref:ImmA/IrrE family metallo-endopeptidase n=1 Tax=Candidatus Amphirhobacter heronislandensis TaxID=1732024 RepID=A0A930UFP4_9GAMM|nr:ImmA/IrrE family metallo-endopeptidase [Betaproteobacteria bacterium AqS2]
MSELAYALDLKKGFFMGERGVPKDDLRVPQFRAAGGQPPRTTEMMLLLRRVENHREYFRGLFEDFPALQPRKVSYPKLREDDGYAAKAKAVRRWLGLSGGEDFAALRQKVEAKDVLVFVGSGGRFGRWQAPKDRQGRDQFKGFALRYDLLPIIFVAKEKDERNQSFTLLHELAHLIMHQKDAIDGEQSLASFGGASRSRREAEANALASHVLLPESALRTIDAKALAGMAPAEIDAALQDVCEQYRVSPMVALARLRTARKVPAAAVDRCYAKWRVKASRPRAQAKGKDDGRVSVAEIREVFGDRYVDMTVKMEREKEITLHDAVIYLDVDLDDYEIIRVGPWDL